MRTDARVANWRGINGLSGGEMALTIPNLMC